MTLTLWKSTTVAALLTAALSLPLLAQAEAPPPPPDGGLAGRGGPPDPPPDGGPEARGGPADRGGPGRGDDPARGGPGRGGAAGPLMEIKTALAVSDDEWAVLLPKIQAVQAAQQDIERGRRGGRAGRGPADRGGPADGRGTGDPRGPAPDLAGPEATQPASALQEAQAALQLTLANKDATVEEIESKMKAVRDARLTSAALLSKAQKELITLLTVRQEAALIQLGIL